MHQLVKNKNSVEGVIAPAGAKVTGATIRTWLLNKFISFLAVLSWKTGLVLFVLRFYGPVNPMGSCRARSVYLATRLLGRLSPLSG